MSSRTMIKRFTFMVSVALLVASCGFEHQPIHLDKGFAESSAARVAVLPVVDARIDRFDHQIVVRNVRDAVIRFLEARNYGVDRLRAAATALPADLNEATVEELAGLAPADTELFLLVQVDRLELADTGELGDSYEMRLSGVLIDPRIPAVLWQDRARGESNLTGLLTILARGSKRYEAANNAARRLLATLPEGLAPPEPRRPGR